MELRKSAQRQGEDAIELIPIIAGIHESISLKHVDGAYTLLPEYIYIFLAMMMYP